MRSLFAGQAPHSEADKTACYQFDQINDRRPCVKATSFRLPQIIHDTDFKCQKFLALMCMICYPHLICQVFFNFSCTLYHTPFITKLSSSFGCPALSFNCSTLTKLKNDCGYPKIIHHISLKCKKFLELSILYAIYNKIVKFFSIRRSIFR